jgi:hypothetical protein
MEFALGEVIEMKDSQLRDFCLALMKADTEEEVIALLKDPLCERNLRDSIGYQAQA